LARPAQLVLPLAPSYSERNPGVPLASISPLAPTALAITNSGLWPGKMKSSPTSVPPVQHTGREHEQKADLR
jgi:hypothetical protein